MTDHIPECPMNMKGSISRCLLCICDALSACEQRVQKIAYAQALQDMTNSLRGAAQRGSISGLAMMEISRTISELREAKR